MIKWFEQRKEDQPCAIYSRIRISRNWDHHQFPNKLSQTESVELIRQLKAGLENLGELDGRTYEFANLHKLSELDRKTLRERRVINSTIAQKKTPTAMLVSKEEDTSIVLNGIDHIRIQLMATGSCLESLWKQADRMDDYANVRFPYAFDPKYGYLTTYPTSVGTGLRASVVVHLPTLSMGKKFQGLVTELSRFGAVIKGVYGEGSENCGALYEVSNQKSLGLTEKEILDLVNRVAGQLIAQETGVRKMGLEQYGMGLADEAYKSFGVLKYARKLTRKDAMTFLSQFLSGLGDGLLETTQPCAVYRLMLGIQPGHLQKLSDRPLGKEELEIARADYLRGELPDLK